MPEINEIRGVDSGGVIGTLLDRKLITTAGRKQVIGRPILYKTTKEFLMRFGLKDVNELPSMEEFEKLVAESFQSELIPAEEAAARDVPILPNNAELQNLPIWPRTPAAERRFRIALAQKDLVSFTIRLVAFAYHASRTSAKNYCRCWDRFSPQSRGIDQRRPRTGERRRGTELGTKADPETDHIRVNGKLLQGAQHHVYLCSTSPRDM